MPQSVNLTGTLRYNPDECYNGYTLLPCSTVHSGKGAVLIDMNGNVVQKWEGVLGAYANILFPDGSIMGTSGINPGHRHDDKDLIHVDWDGNLLWKCDDITEVDLPDGTVVPSARQHHDFQRHGCPTGYYAPGQAPEMDGKTLFCSTKMVDRPDITPHPIADTWLVEVDHDGNVVWDWLITDHWDEMGFSEIGKEVYYHTPILHTAGYTKETYFNNCAYLGPNKWYDAGDERFNPENIIVDIRSWNVMFIIDKKTKEIVWRLGPDYVSDPRLRKIGAIIGMHEVHMIPKGLPGEGNILIFDNGSQANFGNATQVAPDGVYPDRRGYSRVLEIDPTTFELVWCYGEDNMYQNEYFSINVNMHFYSAYCSGMQRLPNGNTLICECIGGRVFEVTPEKKIVWEYVDPGLFTFRAYRYPYNYLQRNLPTPSEKPVVPPAPSALRLENFTNDHFMEDFYGEQSRWL